jgi:hypothetical protein
VSHHFTLISFPSKEENKIKYNKNKKKNHLDAERIEKKQK